MIKHLTSCCCVLLGLLSATAIAGEISIRSYELPGHGFLEIPVPVSWGEEVQQPPNDLPPTIVFYAENHSEVLITPLWSPTNVEGFNSDEKVKKMIERESRGMAPGAVEDVLVIKSIKGPEAHGYYFIATDKAPKPGEWEVAMRSGVGTGQLLLSATVLTHRKDSPVLSEALEALRDVRQVK